MHKQVSALLSSGGSPGKLAIFGKALRDANLDIATIGGAEWHHDGPVSLIIRADAAADRRRFEEVCNRLHVPWLSFVLVTAELDDVPGALGEAAEAVGDINIYSVLVRKPKGNKAVVGLGFRPVHADDAVRLLTEAGISARRRRHPDDPDDGSDWDERTERLLPLWDDPSVAADDPVFWESESSS